MSKQKNHSSPKEPAAHAQKANAPRSRKAADASSAALTQILLDSTPLICAVWDEKGKLVDCNQEMLRLLKIEDKEVLMKRFFDFSPKKQPDGASSNVKGMRLIKQALKTGHQNFKWEYRIADGELLPTETSLVRVKWGDGYRILAYSWDLRELNKAKEQQKLAEERTSMMLNNLPLATYIISDELKVIDCNNAAVRLFNATDKTHVINAFLDDFSPKYQPDGEPSASKAKQYMTQAFEQGRIHFRWTHQAPNGALIPSDITLIRAHWNKQIVLSAYAQDLRDINKAEQEMSQRSAYLRTVNTVAESLLSTNTKNAEDVIENTMEFLAHSMNIDAVKVWMNIEQNGELFYRLYKSWPTSDMQYWPGQYAYNQLPFWKDSMLDNHTVNSFISDLPRAERERLGRKGIKSILAVPLYVEDELWGFMTFEDHQNERVFTDAEEQMLSSVSSLVVSTIVRNRAVSQMMRNNAELRKKSLLLSAVNRVAELILGSEKKDFPLVIQRALKMLGESVHASRASLWVIQYSPPAPPTSKRLAGWQRGKAFSDTMHSLEIKLHEYVPEWDIPAEEMQDLEIPLDEMNANLQRLTILQGSKTLLLIPLILQERFWGYVGFAYDEANHHSTDEERSILRSGSMMIAEAIIRQDITETLEKVEKKAATDHLTGLLTRASFLPQAQALFAESQRHEKPYSVLFLDIDFFKKVNDQYGHAFGDQVLVRLAEIIKSTIRPQDLCCRYGGEEVVIVLANASHSIAGKVAARLLENVQNAKFEDFADGTFHFTVSIGFLSAVPQQDEQFKTYLERADLALYAAKEQGRNRVVDYTAAGQET